MDASEHTIAYFAASGALHVDVGADRALFLVGSEGHNRAGCHLSVCRERAGCSELRGVSGCLLDCDLLLNLLHGSQLRIVLLEDRERCAVKGNIFDKHIKLVNRAPVFVKFLLHESNACLVGCFGNLVDQLSGGHLPVHLLSEMHWELDSDVLRLVLVEVPDDQDHDASEKLSLIDVFRFLFLCLLLLLEIIVALVSFEDFVTVHVSHFTSGVLAVNVWLSPLVSLGGPEDVTLNCWGDGEGFVVELNLIVNLADLSLPVGSLFAKLLVLRLSFSVDLLGFRLVDALVLNFFA